ncbi:MAG TPA: PadR family transcriptional regulator [Burkholderiales bacterium]|nr:PadR family transcriptional regulator [Burkholderiales bacterium]
MKQAGQPATLTATEHLIMELLMNNNQTEMYGLELVEKSEGKLKRGTVYVMLDRLEKKGFIEGRTEVVGSDIPRKVYRPTGLGQQVLLTWRRLLDLGSQQGQVFA